MQKFIKDMNTSPALRIRMEQIYQTANRRLNHGILHTPVLCSNDIWEREKAKFNELEMRKEQFPGSGGSMLRSYILVYFKLKRWSIY